MTMTATDVAPIAELFKGIEWRIATRSIKRLALPIVGGHYEGSFNGMDPVAGLPVASSPYPTPEGDGWHIRRSSLGVGSAFDHDGNTYVVLQNMSEGGIGRSMAEHAFRAVPMDRLAAIGLAAVAQIVSDVQEEWSAEMASNAEAYERSKAALAAMFAPSTTAPAPSPTHTAPSESDAE